MKIAIFKLDENSLFIEKVGPLCKFSVSKELAAQINDCKRELFCIEGHGIFVTFGIEFKNEIGFIDCVLTCKKIMTLTSDCKLVGDSCLISLLPEVCAAVLSLDSSDITVISKSERKYISIVDSIADYKVGEFVDNYGYISQIKTTQSLDGKVSQNYSILRTLQIILPTTIVKGFCSFGISNVVLSGKHCGIISGLQLEDIVEIPGDNTILTLKYAHSLRERVYGHLCDVDCTPSEDTNCEEGDVV